MRDTGPRIGFVRLVDPEFPPSTSTTSLARVPASSIGPFLMPREQRHVMQEDEVK